MTKCPPALLEEEVTREALHYLETSSYTKGELEAYDRYWDTIRTERTYYADAMTKGLAEGRAEGEAIGLEKGKMEALIEIARIALRNNMPVEQIHALTGLPEEKIQEIN